MSQWTLETLRARLGGRAPAAAETERPAAVAVVVRFPEGPDAEAGPSILLMRRTEQEGDPWSGHVSFPGGRMEPGDADLLATAIRETREELGIDLAVSAAFIGGLEPIVATGRVINRPLPATGVAPFVFVETSPLEPRPGPEAESVFWLPIARAAAGDYNAETEYVHQGAPMRFPAWKYQGYVIWGLTLRMLSSLVETVVSTGAP